MHRARARTPVTQLLEIALNADQPRRPKFDSKGFDIIAEVKLNSPAEGELASSNVDRHKAISAQISSYNAGRALAISVLTEPTRFKGHLSDLRIVKGTTDLPVMRKDFLVDPYQIIEARAHHADGVLLIVKILSDDQLTDMIQTAKEHELFLLAECFDTQDINRIEKITHLLGTDGMVGINSRNLSTLEVEIERFAELVGSLPKGPKKVAESGLSTTDQIESVAALGFDAALIGSSLMRADDPSETLASFLTAART